MKLPIPTKRRLLPVLSDESAMPTEDAMSTEDAAPSDLLEVGRRGFLGLSGAIAAATATGCVRRPEEEIHPFTKAPEHVRPGNALHFATVMSFAGNAEGLLVTQNEGRPTKIEGNPQHPLSRGSSSLAAQASIMNLYDPDRARTPSEKGEERKWEDFDAALKERLKMHEADRGAGLRVLMRFTNSLTMIRLREAFAARYPEAKVYNYESTASANAWAGAQLAFGDRTESIHRFDRARVVLSIGGDFLGRGLTTRDARAFASARKPDDGADMNRLYVVESAHSITGAQADHRLRLAPSQIPAYVAALAGALADEGLGDLAALRGNPPKGVPAQWLKEVAKDLRASAGASLVVVGEEQDPSVHAAAHLINRALGNVGQTVNYTLVDSGAGDPVGDIVKLAGEMRSGRIKTLVMLDVNPAYDGPASEGLVDALKKVELVVQASDRVDETAEHAHWQVPTTHFLEAWGDARTRAGTWSISQPLIAPLHGARSALEIFAQLAYAEPPSAQQLVRQAFDAVVGGANDQLWAQSLQAGVVPTAPTQALSLSPQTPAIAKALSEVLEQAKEPTSSALDVQFVPCTKLDDGRYANNPWLLELPESMTKICWDNVATTSPATMRALGLSDGDVVKLSPADKNVSAEIAVWGLKGHADNAFTVPLGWGRRSVGRYGNKQGFDVNPIRTGSMMWQLHGVSAVRTGRRHFVARTQDHGDMPTSMKRNDEIERPIVIHNTLDGYREEPNFAQFKAVEQGDNEYWKPLWKEVEYKGHKWGMSIDLTTCTGCNACVVACQSENNIPNVGKRQVARGREMYWIRIDRYFLGNDENDPHIAMQPIGCQHCEEAPCENVCPVNATTHSPEGLNDMAYNRCIGTRYCMNNCPYKVRRFNFLSWHGRLGDIGTETPKGPTIGPMYGEMPETEKMAFNPEVTVRMRGVMEKCTYCVQRIQNAKISARLEGRRKLGDGEVTSACAQACPSQAIVFGDLNDSSSAVSQARERDRAYRLLAEVGTQPRTSFLAQIRNTNPAMRGGGETGSAS